MNTVNTTETSHRAPRKQAVRNDFSFDIEAYAKRVWAITLVLNFIYWVPRLEGLGSLGWAALTIGSFMVASVIWVINPYHQHYVGFVLLVAAAFVPLAGVYGLI